MKSQNVKIIAIVAVVVVIAALATWQLTKDDGRSEGSMSVSDMANNFADNYSGGFGDFYVESGATADLTSVMTDTGSDRMPHSRLTYSVTDDAKTSFEKIKAELEKKTAMMGAEPRVVGVSGFDGAYAVQFDVRMGTMSTFSMVYFAAYDGNILLDGSTDAFYHAKSLATSEETDALFKGISDSLTCSCKPVSKDASEMAKSLVNGYTGDFGKFYLADGASASDATAQTDTGSDRMPHSKLTYTVTDDAKAKYEAIKAELEKKTAMMGAEPKVVAVSGFDGAYLVKYDVQMGTMSKFTMAYFVAYDGNVLLDASSDCFYCAGTLADDAAIESLMSAISTSLDA